MQSSLPNLVSFLQLKFLLTFFSGKLMVYMSDIKQHVPSVACPCVALLHVWPMLRLALELQPWEFSHNGCFGVPCKVLPSCSAAVVL